MQPDPFAPVASTSDALVRGVGEWRAVMPVPPDAPPAPAGHRGLGKPSATWTYRDANGAALGYIARFEEKDGGKAFRPLVLFRHALSGALAWRWEGWPVPRTLYGLDRLAERPGAPVIVTEGEKAADAAGRLFPAHVAVTSPNGSKSAGKADWSVLAGRAVTIWPDADAPGAAYAETVAGLLSAADSVAIIEPPGGVAPGWDAADAEAAGYTPAKAAALASTARRLPTAKEEPASEKVGRPRRPAQRDSLMGLTTLCDLWHGPDGEAYVSYPIAGHRENWPIRSQNFKRWLAARAFEEMGLAPGAQALEDTLRVLEARATNEGPERAPWLRTGSRDGKIYLDLCDASWRCVEISPLEWRLLERHDAPFIRSSAMRPLPEPEAGESIDTLRTFLNTAEEGDFRLAVAWLVAALRDRGPYPILAINGEQGTGKSNASRILRSLVDPNAAPIRATPRDERDLIVAAYNSHALVFDNLSKVDLWLADALCRISTGGGFSARMLHTDRDEAVFYATRPIVLNGIPALTDRADLADRAITIRLRPIPEDERRPEDEIAAEWEQAAPLVLGALLDAVCSGLRNLPAVKLTRAPRMADFAKWITACEPGLGWDQGSTLEAYEDNRRDVAQNTFEADPVAVALADIARANGRDGWHGTATELLERLNDTASEVARRARSWPATAQGLGNRIDRVAPLLRSRGVHVERRHSGVRTITLVAL
jgi:hypothetical protein